MSAKSKEVVLEAPESAPEASPREPVMRDAGDSQGPVASSPVVPLFKTAHQKLVTLSRLDEQLTALLEQRVSLQREIRDLRTQINQEFDRVLEQNDGSSQKLLDEISRGN